MNQPGTNPGVLAFVAGAELAYAGFDGRPYRARWHAEAQRLDVIDAGGGVFPIACCEGQAVIFWLTVHDRPAPSQPVTGSEPDSALGNLRAWADARPTPQPQAEQGSLF